jgi:hypothetical protein
MSAWLDAWTKNAKALHDRYGIQISRQSDRDPQSAQINQPHKATGETK